MLSKRLYRFFVVILMASLIGHSSFSQRYFQEGFVVNVNQDTTWGYLKIHGNLSKPEGCYFKANENSEPVTFTLPDLIAFGMPKYRHFKKIEYERSAFFAQVLVSGEVSLFSAGKNFYAERNGQIHILDIIEKDVYKKGDAVHSIHTINNYINTLRMLLRDCPALEAEIDKSKLTEQSLVTLIKSFNSCINSTSVVYKSDIPWLKLDLNLAGGLAYSKINVDVSSTAYFRHGYYKLVDFNSFRLVPGIGIMLSSPRVSKNFAFSLEARLIKHTIREQVIFQNATFDLNDVSMRFTAVILPVNIFYQIELNSNVSLFIRGGLINTYIIRDNLITYQRSSQTPNGSVQTLNVFQFFSNQQGFTFGAGARLKSKGLVFFCEPRFENVGELLNAHAVSMNNNVFSLSIGVSF